LKAQGEDTRQGGRSHQFDAFAPCHSASVCIMVHDDLLVQVPSERRQIKRHLARANHFQNGDRDTP